MRQKSKSEDKASNEQHREAKPRKRVIRQRLGIDGQPEPIVTVMDHAPVHSMHLKAPLFISVKNGSQNSGTLVESYYTSPEYRVDCRFEGPQALCIRDQSVLLALCQLGARADQRRWVEKDHPEWLQVSQLLRTSGQGASMPAITLTITAAQIAKVIGLNDSGTNSRSIEESLQRLSTVVMHRTVSAFKISLCDANVGQTNLIGYAPLSGNKKRVVLSAELSLRCVHHNGVSWVNMAEQRALASPPAKRLHAFLSAWASSSELKCIGMGKLLVYIYGKGECEASALKARNLAVRSAIVEIAALPGWWCEVLKKNEQLKIRKPVFAGTQSIAALTPTDSAVALPITAISLPGTLRKVSNDEGFQG